VEEELKKKAEDVMAEVPPNPKIRNPKPETREPEI